MNLKTKKLALTSFVLAMLMLLCSLFPLIPIRKSASAQNDLLDSENRIAYITQSKLTAAPSVYFTLNYSHYNRILLNDIFDFNEVEEALDRCAHLEYNVIILDFELYLYDDTLMFIELQKLSNLNTTIILIHSLGAGQIEQLNYFPFLAFAVSVNEWKHDGMWSYDLNYPYGLCGIMAEYIATDYGTSTKINIVIDYLFYWYYFLLTNNGDYFIEKLGESLNSVEIYDYRLIFQAEEKTSDCKFLIIDSKENTPQIEKTFENGGSIYAEYPEAICGMTTMPISIYTFAFFNDWFNSGVSDFNVYTFVSGISILFNDTNPFPYEIIGAGRDIGFDYDTIPSWLQDKREAFGEYLLDNVKKIITGETIEEKSTYFLYI